MAETSKTIQREGAHLWRYLMEVREIWRSILGAAVVIAFLAVIRWSLSAALPTLTPHLPAAVVPWLSWYRLTVAALVLLVFLAQYLAWRKQYRANHSEGPEIDHRLELLDEAVGLRPSDSEAEIREMQALNIAPDPDHLNTSLFRVRAEIDPPLLDIQGTGPIYSAICVYHRSKEDLVMTTEPVRRKPDRILMQLGEKPLPIGATISLKLFSPAPLLLKKVVIGKVH
ncbi:MAG TPA: hypothetical protein VGH73_12525 [Thermoanaerobaculia bacterium]|jgi:hypothetical protein